MARRVRQGMALLLVFVGGSILVRGVQHSWAQQLGWQGILASLLIGTLVIVLGIARWHYWQQKG